VGATIVFYLHDRLAALHERNLEAALHEREREYYLAQCRIMQETAEQTMAARHDMVNHFAAIKGYAEEKKSDVIRDYTAALLGSIGELKSLSNTGNIAFDSIINYKLRGAALQGIRLDIALAVPAAINMELSDTAVILGNLLDNALYAVAGAEEKWIRVAVDYRNAGLIIKVQNTFDGEVVYADKQTSNGKEERIISRKAGGGQGLANIRRAIEKYDGLLQIEHEGTRFTALVFLYIKEMRNVK